MNNIILAASKTKYKIEGLNLENFVFSLTSSGVGMFKVKRKKNTLIFLASSSNHEIIKDKASQFNVSAIVVDQVGLVKTIKKLPYLIGAFLGVLLSLYLVYDFTSYINRIEYSIEENHLCTNHENCIFLQDNFAQIKEFISVNGISIGKKTNINTRELSNSVLANFELIENCNIIKQGCKITIELVEATGKNNLKYNTIVADKNCIITSITTYSGIAKVKAGDLVKSGQVLVEADGDILPSASITAKVWYIGTQIYNEYQSVYEETGKSQKFTNLECFGKELTKKKDSTFEYYLAEEQVSVINKNLFIPIIKRTITYYEVELKDRFISFETVKDSIMLKAKQEALNKTKADAQECSYSIVREANVVRVDCYVMVQESVGVNK